MSNSSTKKDGSPKTARATPSDGPSQEARRTAATILEVLAGMRTPTEAAEALSVCVSRYYALEQKRLGRFQRPLNNRIRNVMEFLALGEGMPPEAKGIVIVGLLFLVVCSVNLIGILLGKFLARAPEVGVRRALGASRMSIFAQHLIECELVALMGGIAGLGLAILGMRLIEGIFQFDFTLYLDLNMVMAGIAMALFSGLVAGIYPAWRICRIAPATHLRTQ